MWIWIWFRFRSRLFVQRKSIDGITVYFKSNRAVMVCGIGDLLRSGRSPCFCGGNEAVQFQGPFLTGFYGGGFCGDAHRMVIQA